VAATAIAIGLAAPTQAWWGDTHGLLTQAAISVLPQEMPAFFRAGGSTAAHTAFDPDIAKNRGAPHVSHGEFPEHFADIELLRGESLPEQRYEFVALCHRLGVAPEDVGFVPYAITESTERLAVAFAEHRKWPENEAIQAKCLVYAGFLSHYAADLVQPLHATIHYDGRLRDDGSREDGGRIHEQMDSLIERLGLSLDELTQGAVLESIDAEGLFAAVAAQVEESNGQVDRVYALAGDLDPVTATARQMAQERGRRAVSFVGSLYLTAWQMSAAIRLPGWLER
jgi:hypothetical protein